MEDIKLAIIKRLADEDADIPIYDERIQQGFQEPAFLVLSVDGDQTRGIDRRRIRSALFDVHYFPPANTVRREACERMAGILYGILEAAGGYRAQKMRHEVVDEVLHFFVSFSVHLMTEKPAATAMKSINTEVHTS